MSLIAKLHPSSNRAAGASALAWTERNPAGGRRSTSTVDGGGGRPQTVDQIDITSITLNITQGSFDAVDGQLRLGADKVIPTKDGGSVLQPYAEGYFSSPTNFVPTRSDGATSSQATSGASIALQILTETITSQPSPGRAASTAPTGAYNAATNDGSHRSVDISL